MVIPILAILVRCLWIAVEYPYLRRYKVIPQKDWDKNSAMLWDAANLIEPIGMMFGFTEIGRLHVDKLGELGVVVLLVGIVIRWTAIHNLGQYFTGTVLIKNDHTLIRGGLYRYVRHPAYTGTLIAHLGLGLAFSNWISLLFSSIPYALATAYRIHVEEQALRETFDDEYVEYAKQTKRLIPGFF
ncbi:MAG: protein-S-isoprenylcysteine methyltransferase [Blastocatellia bacterium]|nr:MAG: protein-S-isoprenylcysteine methyltransferase [Blastocatellia bacterium]